MKPRCPYCDKPAAVRVETGHGVVSQTLQCSGCARIYRVTICCEDGACTVRTDRVAAA